MEYYKTSTVTRNKKRTRRVSRLASETSLLLLHHDLFAHPVSAELAAITLLLKNVPSISHPLIIMKNC